MCVPQSSKNWGSPLCSPTVCVQLIALLSFNGVLKPWFFCLSEPSFCWGSSNSLSCLPTTSLSSMARSHNQPHPSGKKNISDKVHRDGMHTTESVLGAGRGALITVKMWVLFAFAHVYTWIVWPKPLWPLSQEWSAMSGPQLIPLQCMHRLPSQEKRCLIKAPEKGTPKAWKWRGELVQVFLTHSSRTQMDWITLSHELHQSCIIQNQTINSPSTLISSCLASWGLINNYLASDWPFWKTRGLCLHDGSESGVVLLLSRVWKSWRDIWSITTVPSKWLDL